MRAYGRCYWRNPCNLPTKQGGCLQLYCELHGATFSNFRRFQVCQSCHDDFIHARRCRHNGRIILVIIFLLVAIVVATVTAFMVSNENYLSSRKESPKADKNKVIEILVGELEMDISFSKQVGKLALEAANKMRTENGIENELEWSKELHKIAYQRNFEVAKGVMKFEQSNFMNLFSQATSSYEPNFTVEQLAEQIQKIVNVGFQEDYISDWQNAWTADHQGDILYKNFNKSAVSVYFVEETKEVLFTHLFADVALN